MADETGDTKNLGLGVTFVAIITDFAKQLETIRTELEKMKTDLDNMGKTGKDAAKELTSANVDAEKAISKLATTTKDAKVATEKAAIAAADLGAKLDKAKGSVSGAGGAASKAATDFKGLNFEQMNMMNSVKNLASDSVLGSLVKKLKSAGDESSAYQKGLVGAAKEVGSSEIAFKTLSSALMTNEKYLSTVADGTKKVRAELGAGALPADMKNVVEGVDRLKFAQATLAGEMYKTGGVVLDGRSKFVDLQKTITSLTATHGEAAMKYTDAAARLGAYGTTVKSITGELNAFNAKHTEAVKINTALTEQQVKLNSVYGGPDGLASSTGKYRTEYDRLVGSLDGSKNKMVEVENNVKRLNGSFVTAQKETATFNKAVADLGVQTPRTSAFIADLSDKVNKGNISHTEGTRLVKAHGVELQKLGTTATSVTGFWANLSGKLVGGGAAARAATDYFSRLGQAVGSLAAWIPAALIIGGLTEVITGAIGTIIGFNQSLKSLQAISQGTDAEISVLGDEMLKVSNNTKYSLAEIGKGAIFIAQAGFSAGEALVVLSAAAKGAQGTLEPLNTAADLLTTVIRAFDKDAQEASSIMDMLAMAANKSKTNLEGMRTVFNYIGPTAKAAGVELSETLAALMLLSNAGMRMSTIGTSLRQVFINLEAPNRNLREALKLHGMTIADLNVKELGLVKVSENLGKVIHENLANAVHYFSVRAGNAALVLSSMPKNLKAMAEATMQYGSAAAMAEKQAEGMEVSLHILLNRFNNMFTVLSDAKITGVFKLLIDGFSGVLSLIGQFAKSSFGGLLGNFALLTTATWLFVTGINALSVAIVGMGIKSVFAAGVLKVLRASVMGFLTTIGPIGWVAIALGVLGTVLVTTANSQKEATEQAEKDSIVYEQQGASIDAYIKKLEELKKKKKEEKDISIEYVSVMEAMGKAFPELIPDLIGANNDLEKQIELLKKVSIERKQLAETKAVEAFEGIRTELTETQAKLDALMRAKEADLKMWQRWASGVVNVFVWVRGNLDTLFGNNDAVNVTAGSFVQLNAALATTKELSNINIGKAISTLSKEQLDKLNRAAVDLLKMNEVLRETKILSLSSGQQKTVRAYLEYLQKIKELKVGDTKDDTNDELASQKQIDAKLLQNRIELEKAINNAKLSELQNSFQIGLIGEQNYYAQRDGLIRKSYKIEEDLINANFALEDAKKAKAIEVLREKSSGGKSNEAVNKAETNRELARLEKIGKLEVLRIKEKEGLDDEATKKMLANLQTIQKQMEYFFTLQRGLQKQVFDEDISQIDERIAKNNFYYGQNQKGFAEFITSKNTLDKDNYDREVKQIVDATALRVDSLRNQMALKGISEEKEIELGRQLNDALVKQEGDLAASKRTLKKSNLDTDFLVLDMALKRGLQRIENDYSAQEILRKANADKESFHLSTLASLNDWMYSQKLTETKDYFALQEMYTENSLELTKKHLQEEYDDFVAKTEKKKAEAVGDTEVMIALDESLFQARLKLNADLNKADQDHLTNVIANRQKEYESWEYLYSTKGVVGVVKRALSETEYALNEYGRRTKELIDSITQGMSDSFKTYFVDVMKGDLKNASDYFNAFIDIIRNSIAKFLADQMTQSFIKLIQAGINAYFPSINTPTTTTSLYAPGPGEIPVTTMHTGGIVGKDGTNTTMPSWLLSMAPRFHTGLKADEFPAILQRGEVVMKKGDKPGMQGPSTIEVRVINESGTPVKTRESKVSFDAQKTIVTLWLDALNRNAYGLRSAIGG
jgi:TP901 family phage tail tape measure protein